MRPLALLLFAGLAVQGCSDSPDWDPKAQKQGPVDLKIPAGQWDHTPHGGAVWVPDWLPSPGREHVLAEIDATEPLNVTGPAGVPAHWKVVILDPGTYPFYYEGKFIQAWGHTDYQKQKVYVAWRNAAPNVPALSHELAHVYAGPGANH